MVMVVMVVIAATVVMVATGVESAPTRNRTLHWSLGKPGQDAFLMAQTMPFLR